jgi:hypothetical protein
VSLQEELTMEKMCGSVPNISSSNLMEAFIINLALKVYVKTVR